MIASPHDEAPGTTDASIDYAAGLDEYVAAVCLAAGEVVIASTNLYALSRTPASGEAATQAPHSGEAAAIPRSERIADRCNIVLRQDSIEKKDDADLPIEGAKTVSAVAD